MKVITVEKMLPGSSAVISEIFGEPLVKRRLMEMGVLPGSVLKLIKWAPLGDPAECQIRGYKLSIRRSEAAMISVSVEGSE
ncbi:MAG: ferrous iron transport protein A [Methanospirillum sp.]|uniref:FeoA family protein n=1 Tax=Methanospirillum sp. TaxID=45200 RepID=UPI00236C6511|nr:FeoA family protein [Methanospirillum sp.]MDD1729138.1 ferrous iron transport protein A [Methanospirillum sp.]